jgi:hypothetical protein
VSHEEVFWAVVAFGCGTLLVLGGLWLQVRLMWRDFKKRKHMNGTDE